MHRRAFLQTAIVGAGTVGAESRAHLGGGLLVVASGSMAGAFIATAGGLRFLGGLITLIVGRAQRAS